MLMEKILSSGDTLVRVPHKNRNRLINLYAVYQVAFLKGKATSRCRRGTHLQYNMYKEKRKDDFRTKYWHQCDRDSLCWAFLISKTLWNLCLFLFLVFFLITHLSSHIPLGHSIKGPSAKLFLYSLLQCCALFKWFFNLSWTSAPALSLNTIDWQSKSNCHWHVVTPKCAFETYYKSRGGILNITSKHTSHLRCGKESILNLYSISHEYFKSDLS